MFDSKINSDAAANAVDVHRNAYNAAFYELGLRWHWDGDTYQTLLCKADEKDRIRIYLETHQPHLLKAYDADFLIDAIQTTKSRCYDTMTAAGSKLGAYINWAEIQQREVGV
ncbi:hypothetical protein ACFQAT_10635 [Undibacterium arcticum]|uniref:Uncharacterized protein n=1 Tax=Undibacterium arcticum TaxID=1762892 RepID=A0ABV7FB75_9BURK